MDEVEHRDINTAPVEDHRASEASENFVASDHAGTVEGEQVLTGSPALDSVEQPAPTDGDMPVFDEDKLRAEQAARAATAVRGGTVIDPARPHSMFEGFPKTLHHPVHGARTFENPNDYAEHGEGYDHVSEHAAQWSRTPLEADLSFRRMQDRLFAGFEQDREAREG